MVPFEFLQWLFFEMQGRYRADKSCPLPYIELLDDRKAPALRDQAKRYRAMARRSTDDENANCLFKLAAELEEQARNGKPDDE